VLFGKRITLYYSYTHWRVKFNWILCSECKSVCKHDVSKTTVYIMGLSGIAIQDT